MTDLTNLCALLGPGDFAAAGISGAGSPTENSDGPGSAYCIFAGQSGATGGLELDVFVDAASAADTFDTIVSESGTTMNPITVAGVVDEAVATDGDSTSGYAAIAVRSGALVFSISGPAGAGMSAKLAALAGVVLARGAGLIG